jgi:Ca-activated chloride channel homolog
LADAGDGNYAYIDSAQEASKVLARQVDATLFTVAKDVKVQIEFNPNRVAEYRLIGYENRLLKREDFNNDQVDAGDIGAGHTVTALYEIAPAGSKGTRIDPLRYQSEKKSASDPGQEWAFLRLRYKGPEGGDSRLIELPITQAPNRNPDAEFRFAAAVAAFGQMLRGGQYLERFGWNEIITLARAGRGDDPHGERAELVGLAELARDLGVGR